MIEVMDNPAQPAHWKAVAVGEQVDWNEVFAGYEAQVDWPGAHVWDRTAAAFPEAHVIHTERPEADWWNSFSVTIGKFFRLYEAAPAAAHSRHLRRPWTGSFMKETFERPRRSRPSDRGLSAKQPEGPRRRFPAHRLLIFNVAEGWAPLCRFLEVPVPATPFPRSHPRDEFWAHFGGEPA